MSIVINTDVHVTGVGRKPGRINARRFDGRLWRNEQPRTFERPGQGPLPRHTPPRRKEISVPWLESAKRWARSIKRDIVALWIAGRDPAVPLHVKVCAAAVAAYALSPIDLIPDFIPVLGYLDDLLIVPLGVLLVVRMIPPDLMTRFRAEAELRDKPVSTVGLVLVIAVWLACLLLAGWWMLAK